MQLLGIIYTLLLVLKELYNQILFEIVIFKLFETNFNLTSTAMHSYRLCIATGYV